MFNVPQLFSIDTSPWKCHPYFLGTPTVGSAFQAQEKILCSYGFSSIFFPGLLPTQKRVAEQTLGVPRIKTHIWTRPSGTEKQSLLTKISPDISNHKDYERT
jgi:hypothetical protein